MYDKPEALVYYEQIQLTGQLLFRGGIMDQPYIFMMEYAICHQFVELFRRMLQQQQSKEKKNA